MTHSAFPAIETPEGARVCIDGTPYDWFRGNGYLGLYGNQEILQACCDATLRYGMKLRGKRAVGCHPCLLELERNACRFFGAEAVVYFNSGYAGNAVLLAALRDDCDLVCIDREAHFSIVDAAHACGKPLYRFAHRDPEDLRRLLARQVQPGQRPLVMSDAIFPISGRLAPVPEYWQVLDKYDHGLLCLDDAHGAGVLGANGRGALEYFGLQGPRRYSCTTMSKAFGTYGGLIASDARTIQRINTRSGVCRGASPPPPGVTAASAKAFEIAIREPEIRHTLARNVSQVRQGLHDLGLDVDIDSPSPIICLARLRHHPHPDTLCRTLFAREHIAVLYMQQGYPGLPPDGALLLTVFASHAPAQIARLLDAFRRSC
jgi:glycine C-acetyltransferase/8-amino-7-oxononanoate synthase